MAGKTFVKFLVVAIVLLLTWSCNPTKKIGKTAKIRPISTAKLLKKVQQNTSNYEYLTIKNIRCNFKSTQSKATFKVNLKAKRDDKILVSISKLSLPVGRLLLTPDSVKYVNYIQREYFTDDYSFLSSFLHIDLDFATIQSIISNNAFSYRNDPNNKDYRNFKSYVQANEYVLQSEKERRIYKLDKKVNTKQIKRRLKRLDDDALIVQRMYFNPESFALTKLNLDDKTNQRNMTLLFQNFLKVEDTEYPREMDMKFTSPNENLAMKLNLNGFSTRKIKPLSLKIPQKYKRTHVNKH